MKYKLYFICILMSFFNILVHANTLEFNTDNGMRVLFYENHEVPMLDIELVFKAGSVYDANAHGIALLTSHLLNQGNAGKSFTEIANALANTGAQYEAQTTKDYTALHLKTLSANPEYDKAINIFKLIFSRPNFPSSAVIQQKNQIKDEIIHNEEVPDAIANRLFYQNLYDNHPYKYDLYGDVKSLSNINRTQILQFYNKYYCLDNAVLTIVGDIDLTHAKLLAKNLSSSLKKGKKAAIIPTAHDLSKSVTTHINFPSTQTVLRIGQVAIEPQDPLYFPLTVGNYILGGNGLVSKLQKKLREENGLTYGVVSQFSALEYKGPFVIGFSTKNSTAEFATKLTLEVLKNFLDNGPTQKDLLAAKKYLIGSFPVALSSNAQISEILRYIAFYNLPTNYLQDFTKNIKKISITDIKKAFDIKLKNKPLLIISVGGKI